MCEKLRLCKNIKNKRGISLILLIITIIVILILAASVIFALSKMNPIGEANSAKYKNDRDNMQALFTDTLSAMLIDGRGEVVITPGTITDEVSCTITGRIGKADVQTKIVFGKGTDTDTVYYTGAELPEYEAGETVWSVDADGILSLKVKGVNY